MLIGIANVIPGVSGGTMAVILNIYDKIMYAISLKNIRSNLKFLIPLAFGALAGIFALSNVIVGALERYPMVLKFCFIGLILGSIPAIFKRAKGEEMHSRNWLFFFLALAFMLFLAIVNPDAASNRTLEEFGGLTPWLCLWLFFTAAVSMIAMILPGVSGSLVMLLFGTYAAVMEAISDLNVPVLACVAPGILIGGIVGVKVIKKMLRFHPQALYFGILGLMIGSITSIWPGFTANAQGIIAIAGLIVFGLAAYLLSSRD